MKMKMKMKMERKHYNLLELIITTYLKDGPCATVDDYIRRGWTARKWRWDTLWESIFAYHNPQSIMFRLYDYLDDSHIDTALRKITKTK